MLLKEAMAKILDVFPNATIGDDNDGQLIIYTDMWIDYDESLVPFGSCDSCGSRYDTGSRADHCGDCGNCLEHCKCAESDWT